MKVERAGSAEYRSKPLRVGFAVECASRVGRQNGLK